MSRINGEKARAALQRRKRAAQRLKTRIARAAATAKPAPKRTRKPKASEA